MRHTLDQEYLAYKHRLHEYQANVVVVGLPGGLSEGLDNQYLPFRAQGAHGMPYLKPRFELNSGELSLLPLPPKWMHDNYFKSSDLCRLLEQTDAGYSEFDSFKRFGQLPFSGTIWYLCKRGRNLSRLIWGDNRSVPLLKSLMAAMVSEGEAHGASVVFLILPDLDITAPGGWRKYLPDHYAALLDELREERFDIVDARQVLLDSGLPMWELYYTDAYHYTPTGNRVIAEALKDRISRYLKSGN
jgi:hypothetical protein